MIRLLVALIERKEASAVLSPHSLEGPYFNDIFAILLEDKCQPACGYPQVGGHSVSP
jgi:hypothetical protein